MREEREKERKRGREEESFFRALSIGTFQIPSRVTPRPMRIPRWVPDSLRGRSGQGEPRSSSLSPGHREGGAVGMATDLSLLMPRPETTEKEEMRRRAGEIERTELEKRAKSSAKAKGRMSGSLDKKQRRGS